MKTIAQRLNKLMKDGSLTVRDLQRWLGRPYPTVRMWVVGEQEPWAVWRDEVEDKVSLLESLVRAGRDFPVPSSFSPRDRRELILGLVHERDSCVSRKRSAARG